jgi:hypothetical protein
MRLLPDSLATEEVVGRTVARAGLSRLWSYKDRPSPTVPARRGPNYLPERGTSKPIHRMCEAARRYRTESEHCSARINERCVRPTRSGPRQSEW